MSKRNMLLGLATGKIGDLVFYRDGGEQRTRTRVVPKNPRSLLQMAQRVKIANVSAFYRLYAAIIKDSFTNLPSNQTGYNAFAKQAISISPYVTREMALRGTCLPAPYALSKGVLPSLTYFVDTEEENLKFSVVLRGLNSTMKTIGEVSAAIIANNSGFQNGDKIVCMAAGFTPSDAADGVGTYTAFPVNETFLIDTTSEAPISSIGFVASEQSLIFMPEPLGDMAIFAAIHVKEDSAAGLMVSSSVAKLSTAAQSLYQEYRSETALNNAVLSYGAGSESILRE